MNGSERDARRGHHLKCSATRPAAFAAVMLAGALALVACGGGSSTSSVKAGGSEGAATVKTASESGVGTVLTNSAGRTLYLYTPDAQKSVTCSGSCAQFWTALTVKGSPVAGSGVKASLLGTDKSGGKNVVTYNGWPLYTYVGDHAAKQDKGEGNEGTWYVVNTSGKAVKAKAAPSGGGSGGGGGYGY